MKIKILAVSLTLVLLTIGLSGCLNPQNIAGTWVLHNFDSEGNEILPSLDVQIVVNGIDVTVTNPEYPTFPLFEGKMNYDSQRQQWIIESSSADPFDNVLFISKIYIQSNTFMVSDKPLIESFNPYQFTR
jgi:hypothetical protein